MRRRAFLGLGALLGAAVLAPAAPSARPGRIAYPLAMPAAATRAVVVRQVFWLDGERDVRIWHSPDAAAPAAPPVDEQGDAA